MKRSYLHISALGTLMLAAVSCGPSRYMIDVEMRHKSEAGLDLTGKNVTVAYPTASDSALGAYMESFADGFAWSLQDQYKQSIDGVGVYALPGSGTEYASRDSLVNVLMKTGSDVVFLFDKLDFSSVSLRCYDAMNQDDKMLSYAGQTGISPSDISSLPTEAWDKGKSLATSFIPQWKHEQYSIYYFDTEQWLKAVEKAEMYDWKGAMDIWFTFLDSGDAMKRSCASFNIATACYMLGDYALAIEWLDQSDKDLQLQISSVLRKRINARK